MSKMFDVSMNFVENWSLNCLFLCIPLSCHLIRLSYVFCININQKINKCKLASGWFLEHLIKYNMYFNTFVCWLPSPNSIFVFRVVFPSTANHVTQLHWISRKNKTKVIHLHSYRLGGRSYLKSTNVTKKKKMQ